MSATVTIPTTAAVGAHQIVATGPNSAGGTHRLTIDLTVAGSSLPATGASIGLIALVALGLVLVGLELVGVSVLRTRRATGGSGTHVPSEQTWPHGW
jgi:LPXTG-motif cell wall-anchored protein